MKINAKNIDNAKTSGLGCGYKLRISRSLIGYPNNLELIMKNKIWLKTTLSFLDAADVVNPGVCKCSNL